MEILLRQRSNYKSSCYTRFQLAYWYRWSSIDIFISISLSSSIEGRVFVIWLYVVIKLNGLTNLSFIHITHPKIAPLMRSSGVTTLITENYIFAQRRSIGWQKSNDTDPSSSFGFCSPSLVFKLQVSNRSPYIALCRNVLLQKSNVINPSHKIDFCSLLFS